MFMVLLRLLNVLLLIVCHLESVEPLKQTAPYVYTVEEQELHRVSATAWHSLLFGIKASDVAKEVADEDPSNIHQKTQTGIRRDTGSRYVVSKADIAFANSLSSLKLNIKDDAPTLTMSGIRNPSWNPLREKYVLLINGADCASRGSATLTIFIIQKKSSSLLREEVKDGNHDETVYVWQDREFANCRCVYHHDTRKFETACNGYPLRSERRAAAAASDSARPTLPQMLLQGGGSRQVLSLRGPSPGSGGDLRRESTAVGLPLPTPRLQHASPHPQHVSPHPQHVSPHPQHGQSAAAPSARSSTDDDDEEEEDDEELTPVGEVVALEEEPLFISVALPPGKVRMLPNGVEVYDPHPGEGSPGVQLPPNTQYQYVLNGPADPVDSDVKIPEVADVMFHHVHAHGESPFSEAKHSDADTYYYTYDDSYDNSHDTVAFL